MATDYDAPRRTETDDVSEDSLEELKARRNEAQSAVVDVDAAWACPPEPRGSDAALIDPDSGGVTLIESATDVGSIGESNTTAIGL